MCGITGILRKRQTAFDLREKISLMSGSLAHRGPDGEGFILGNLYGVKPLGSEKFSLFSKNGNVNYLPSEKLNSANENEASFAFAHRRLSILDLSELGHQPMCCIEGKVWLTFNGEIYNYKELKIELEADGVKFISDSDTEVVVYAYKKWGTGCVEHFNGMWSFCIYDSDKKLFFASRDRLGVKPFYYINSSDAFCFASEQKAFVKAGFVKASYSSVSVHNYLVNGLLETSENNFFEGVKELWPGFNLIYSLENNELKTEKYYSIHFTNDNDRLNEEELILKIRAQLFNAVKLRMRSDVEVGACLSGGIDSSVICGIMAQNTDKPFSVFTSVFKSESFNEERFADIVSSRIKAKAHKTEPDYNDFLKELDQLVYSQDVPIWDTSTYAQYKVLELAAKNNIKVVIDGQGADELFAGYHHHLNAYWKSTQNDSGILKTYAEIKKASLTISNPLTFHIKELLKERMNLNSSLYKRVFRDDFLKVGEILPSSTIFNTVNGQLKDDIERVRLKSFLKCEDRCGMWHSVESRTPFSDDVDLINLMFSFNGSRKIKDGKLKYLLREAGKDVLPPEIYTRYDKRGFETPMQKWVLKLQPQMVKEIEEMKFEFIRPNAVQTLNPVKAAEAKLLFKLFILARWEKVFRSVTL